LQLTLSASRCSYQEQKDEPSLLAGSFFGWWVILSLTRCITGLKWMTISFDALVAASRHSLTQDEHGLFTLSKWRSFLAPRIEGQLPLESNSIPFFDSTPIISYFLIHAG